MVLLLIKFTKQYDVLNQNYATPVRSSASLPDSTFR